MILVAHPRVRHDEQYRCYVPQDWVGVGSRDKYQQACHNPWGKRPGILSRLRSARALVQPLQRWAAGLCLKSVPPILLEELDCLPCAFPGASSVSCSLAEIVLLPRVGMHPIKVPLHGYRADLVVQGEVRSFRG